ncbi:MAG: hypothetical protein J6X85_08330, partial [Ruminococcus sp.]|nr:hypothetical protein [Ruminococcus sp.]
YTGYVYARAYLNGVWSSTTSYYVSNSGSLNAPTFSRSGNYLYINSNHSNALIYYSMGTNNVGSGSAYITAGGSLYVGNYTGYVYARAYENGVWSSTSSYYVGSSATVARPTITSSGSTVRFSSSTNGATIYYSTSTSNVTSASPSVYNGGSVNLSGFTGYVYARAYYNGSWSEVTSYYVNNYASYLTTPTLYGTAINNQVSLQWTSVSNAQNYYIYRYENGSYIQIGTVSGSATQCYVNNVSNGTHRFAIKAAASGQTSQYSNLATVTVNYSLYPGYPYRYLTGELTSPGKAGGFFRVLRSKPQISRYEHRNFIVNSLIFQYKPIHSIDF